MKALIQLLAAGAGICVLLGGGTRVIAQSTLPPGFVDEVVLSGLSSPTAIRFSPDGRVFVAEKSGLVKVFASLSDPAPTVFADLRTNVHNYWDRGLLGLTLDPGFPTRPYVYVFYTYDGPIYGYDGLSPDQIVANVQYALQQLGYFAESVDGVLGSVTRAAIEDYQVENNLPVTGAIDRPLLVSLGFIY